MRRFFAIVLTFVIAFVACTERKPSNPYPNRPPDTHLFLVIGDSLGVPDTSAMPDTSSSMLVLHWYGDDPDGEVIGFQWAWDDTMSETVEVDSLWWLNDSSYTEVIDNPDSITIDTVTVGPWTFTEDAMDTFYVKIREAFNYFTFYVRAVDSDSEVDPTPATMTFPIINSPPTVQLPAAFVNDYSAEHSITLGYQTLTWTGRDPDGDETISGYQLSLTDTSFHWDPDTTINDTIRFADLDWAISLDSLTFSYTFSNLEPGCYRIFLRSYDIAGSYSKVVYYPETTGVWQVIESRGDILYIDDNSYYSHNDTLFTHFLDSLGLEHTALSFVEKPFYYSRDFASALSDFRILIYNAGSSRHFLETGPAIANFVNSGGHLLVNATYSGTDTTIYPFMPIDSVFDYEGLLVRPSMFVQPDIGTHFAGFPDTLRTTQVGFFSYTFGFVPRVPDGISGSGYKVLYTIAANDPAPQIIGDTVAVRFPYDPDAETQPPAKVIFFSFPMFECNVNSGFSQMYSHILMNEFADE